MVDDDRWRRLAFHILTELETETDEDPVAVERAAVLIYAAIHERLSEPRGELSN